ncbi:low density lipoprotein receptor adapter protein 1-like isoform X2 [Sipha flava]|uniref:Low density lipoprotein receptor adapter protein 1-like isoform X2 n=1 Tax=Sipha flava TaxID=143950 RepID=A0A8B8GKX4_9HEMI|nr:low density lipoprotein receptor adapter protein 1-like isoform X2 [Sipha flava]
MPLSLKSIWKGNSKHKKLSEDKSLAIGQNADDVAAIADESDQTTFDVKYLGNTPVDSAAGAVAEAVKTILLMAKASKRKSQNVTVTLNGQGIRITETNDDKKTVLDTPIERVSHCFTDSTHSNVFAFVIASGQSMSECHAFMCAKRKMAQNMSITISQLISSVPDVWKEYNKQKSDIELKTPEIIPNTVRDDVAQEVKEAKLIDLSGEPLPRQQYDTSRWVLFEDDPSSKLDVDLLPQRPEGFANFSHHFKPDRQMCC